MKIAICTLGCKVNQYETQAMERLLRARGHEIVDFAQAADVYVVNSCSVTAVSDQKSRQALHKIRRQRPGAVLALCGCYAQTHRSDMEGLDVDLIAGTGDRTGFIPPARYFRPIHPVQLKQPEILSFTAPSPHIPA